MFPPRSVPFVLLGLQIFFRFIGTCKVEKVIAALQSKLPWLTMTLCYRTWLVLVIASEAAVFVLVIAAQLDLIISKEWTWIWGFTAVTLISLGE